MEAGSWNARKGNSRIHQTRISRSSLGRKNDPDDQDCIVDPLEERDESPSMKPIIVNQVKDPIKVKRPVAWLVVGRREEIRVGNLLEVGRNTKKTISSYATPRCLPDRF